MRRAFALTAFAAVVGLVSLGCKSTQGRCDCNYDPANSQLNPPSNPYPTVGAPVKAEAKPETPMPMPKTKN